jgi:hypothetical protein
MIHDTVNPPESSHKATAANLARRPPCRLWAPAIAVGRHGSNAQNIQFGAQGALIAGRPC